MSSGRSLPQINFGIQGGIQGDSHRWGIRGIVHFEVLEPGETANAGLYCEQLDRLNQSLIEKYPAIINRKGVILQHDNARPHYARKTLKIINGLGWEVLPHPPYSPDIAPTDFHLFRSMQHFLANKKFQNLDDMKNAIFRYLTEQPTDFYRSGIENLHTRWQKVVANEVLDYGCEAVILASTTNLGKYDFVQNSALRIITGGAKSTLTTEMQLQTGIEPLDSHVQRSDFSSFTSGTSYEETPTSATNDSPCSRRKGSSGCVYSTVPTAFPFKRFNLTNLTSNKADAIPEELKSWALETIEERYPANEWLHFCIDGSYLPETNRAGTGWFCKLFEGSLAMGKNASNYDAEVLAVCEATTHLLSAGLAPAKVVFIDSHAAIIALSNNTPTDCLNTIQCRTKIAELNSYG
ncbi:histone-lysine N-methyltransferase SETMAR [Trichonephila clavipes]|nr:histone-lysine N-methyltransferase SETMAR [Trichonephila clavipes]